MAELDKYDILLTIMKETKEDMGHIRQSNVDIRDEMHRLSGQLALVVQDINTQKTDTKERLERVNIRIDRERDSRENAMNTVVHDIKNLEKDIRMDIKDLKKTVEYLKPSATTYTKVTDSFIRWVVPITIIAVVGFAATYLGLHKVDG